MRSDRKLWALLKMIIRICFKKFIGLDFWRKFYYFVDQEVEKIYSEMLKIKQINKRKENSSWKEGNESLKFV